MGGQGETYTTETLEWSRWLKMGLSAAKLGKAVLSADAITDLPGVVDQVKGLYGMYTTLAWSEGCVMWLGILWNSFVSSLFARLLGAFLERNGHFSEPESWLSVRFLVQR